MVSFNQGPIFSMLPHFKLLQAKYQMILTLSSNFGEQNCRHALVLLRNRSFINPAQLLFHQIFISINIQNCICIPLQKMLTHGFLFQAAFSRRTTVRQIEEFLSGRLHVNKEDMRLWLGFIHKLRNTNLNLTSKGFLRR